MLFRKKKIQDRLGIYPSADMLNNALRYLLEDETKTDNAISEILFALHKADGYLHEDIADKLSQRNKQWRMYAERLRKS